MASSTTRPTASTTASSVNRFSVKPKTCIKNTAPMSETGIATSGTNTVRSDPRNRKMTTMTMSTVSVSVRTTSWMASLMYSVESKATTACIPVGSSALTMSISLRTRAMTSTRVGVGQDPHPHEDGAVAGEADVLVVRVGAEDDVGDVLQADERVADAADDELLEFAQRLEIGGGRQVDLNQLPFGLPHRGEVVVRGQRRAHLRGAHVERRHAGRP